MAKPNDPNASGGAPRCEECEAAPPVYIGKRGEVLCADCACYTSAVGAGEKYSAVRVLDFAVGQMRAAQFSDEQIRAAVDATLTGKDLIEVAKAWKGLAPQVRESILLLIRASVQKSSVQEGRR